MKDLAPHIFRQRLLIEGLYDRPVDPAVVLEYFNRLLSELGMSAAGNPVINSSVGQGKRENQGIEAFIPLIESGVALYTWESTRFISLIIYTCKAFENETALDVTRDFFQIAEMEYRVF